MVWIGMEGDEIVSGHMDDRLKLRNVRRDPRVAISFEGTSPPGTFLADYAVLHGTARVTSGGAAELLHRLGRVYVGRDFVFPVSAPSGRGIRVEDERRTSRRPRVVGADVISAGVRTRTPAFDNAPPWPVHGAKLSCW
jgi:hypothetical protein